MYGSLVIEGGGDPTRHELAMGTHVVGRGLDCDVVLDHSTVSRHHARLDCDVRGCRVADLGSANGTRVEGEELAAKVELPLRDGARIEVGPFVLIYHAAAEGGKAPGAAAIAEGVAPPAAIQTMVVAAAFPPRLVVNTAAGATDHVLQAGSLTLGREPDNDIVVDDDVVSRHHARLERRGSRFEIVDLGSTNGLAYQGKHVESHVLADGDVVWIGKSVRLEFHGGAPSPRAEGVVVGGVAGAGAPAVGARLAGDRAAGVAGGIQARLDLPSDGALVLGRSVQADLTIAHPLASGVHARIVRHGGQLYVEDMGSSYGTFVNGSAVREQPLREGDVIRIASQRLIVEEAGIRVADESAGLCLQALHLERVVGRGIRILRDVSLAVQPQEFVAVVGASGSGKSTLLNALCGFRPATSGVVLLNDVDLYAHYDAYRAEMGYVPQDDIIHQELLVRRALDYAARLRMPPDTTTQERRARIDEVLGDLDLRGCGDLPVKQLSGGQRKRVSIGVELLTRPSLFFLDEATSGLDPGTEGQMMRLLRHLADQGRTVMLVTHATKNVMTCDKVIFMARGGHLAYYGAPEQALAYFEVNDFDEIYTRLDGSQSEQWAQYFVTSPQYRENVQERLGARLTGAGPGAWVQGSQASPTARAGRSRSPAARPPASPSKGTLGAGGLKQLSILSQRYVDTIWRDRKTAALLILLPVLLGALDFFTWDRKLFDAVEGSAVQVVTMLFMVCLVTILVGTVVSVREIVKEDAIYRRERMVGLQVVPYVGSKVLVGLGFALYSALVLFAFKLLAVDFSHLGVLDTVSILVPLVIGTFAGVMWGLVVSAVAPSEDRAMLLVILVLVPQFVFSGGMIPVADLGVAGQVVGVFTSTRWELGALATAAGVRSGDCVAPDLSDCYLPGIDGLQTVEERRVLLESLNGQYGDIFDVSLPLYWGMGLALALVLLLITVVLQKRKDRR